MKLGFKFQLLPIDVTTLMFATIVDLRISKFDIGYALFQASVPIYIIPALCWVFTQRVVVNTNRRFGITCRSRNVGEDLSLHAAKQPRRAQIPLYSNLHLTLTFISILYRSGFHVPLLA